MRKVPPSFSSRRIAWRYLDAWLPSSVNVVRSTFASSPSFTNVRPKSAYRCRCGLADFVEDRHAAEVVAPLEEVANQIVEPIVWSDRIAERDPGAPLHAVHDERGSIVVEQQRLVPEIHQIREGRRLSGDRPTGVFEVGVGRRGRLVRRIPDQAGKPEQQQHRRRADRGAEESRGFAVHLELPPELVRVVHVLEREQSQPDRGCQRRRSARQSTPRRSACRKRRRGDRRPAAPAATPAKTSSSSTASS